MKETHDTDPHTFRLAASLGIRDCAALKASLLPLLQRPEPVAIDVAAVERLDTAVLQLLFAFARDRRLNGRTVSWKGTNEVWRLAAATLNPDTAGPAAAAIC